MRKKLTICSLIVIMCFTAGCQNDTAQTNDNNQTTIEMTWENEEISEDEDITDEYLEEKYPGKYIVHWVYGEKSELTEEDLEDGMKYGERAITNEQIIRLNDYLTSQEKDYVISFSLLGAGEEYLNQVKEMVEENSAPDIISAGTVQSGKNYRLMKYDFISEGLLEELTPYLDTSLKDYAQAVPENKIKLSEVNGKFYGYSSSLGYLKIKYYWYVNEEIAEKYNIDIDGMEQMDYEDWLPYLEKVYEGEKEEGTKDFKTMNIYTPRFENYYDVLGYTGKLDGTSYIYTDAVMFNMTTGQFESIYQSEKIKNGYSAYVKYHNAGYFTYLNPSLSDKDLINTGNCFLFADYNESAKEELEFVQQTYPQVKSLKRIKYCETVSNPYTDKSGGVTGICSKSENKEMAMEALNYIYSDMVASNIIKFPQYETGDEDFSIDEICISDYENYGGPSSLLYNAFLTFQAADDYINVDDIIKNIEGTKLDDNVTGKIYDYSSVKTEINSVIKTVKKYMGKSGAGRDSLLKGDFEENWSQFMEELEEAGIEKIVNYLNGQ